MDIGETKETTIARTLSKHSLDKEALRMVVCTGWEIEFTPRSTSLAVTLHRRRSPADNRLDVTISRAALSAAWLGKKQGEYGEAIAPIGIEARSSSQRVLTSDP